MKPRRRLVVTVCPLEPGVVVLPVERGGRPRRMGARDIAVHLESLVRRRRLGDYVRIRQGCAGGCSLGGPNVGVTIYPAPRPGERSDHVAVGWRSYVYSIARLDCLATIVDENLRAEAVLS